MPKVREFRDIVGIEHERARHAVTTECRSQLPGVRPSDDLPGRDTENPRGFAGRDEFVGLWHAARLRRAAGFRQASKLAARVAPSYVVTSSADISSP